MARIPIIIDTDTAQDDCVTILLGLLDPYLQYHPSVRESARR